MWRAYWEKRWVPSQFTAASSPGTLPCGLAWRRCASEAADINLQASAGSKDQRAGPWSGPVYPPAKASLTA